MSDHHRDETPNVKRWSMLQRIFAGTTIQTLIQSAGFVFAIVAAIGFYYAVIRIIGSSGKAIRVDRTESPELFWQHLIADNIEIVSIIIVAILSVMFALRLFSKAGSLTSEVIRERDRKLLEPLISAANKEAINEYIRLASLSGFAGTFQYLGFTGLPLATVVLTLVLLFTALWVDDDDLRRGMFDMAKLTLGAFLGSFVQRNVEQERLTQTPVGRPGTPDGASGDDRVAIGKDLDGMAAQVQAARASVGEKLNDDTKRAQVQPISDSLAEIEKKVAAAQDSVRDASQPMDKVRSTYTEAKSATSQLNDLTQRLQAI